MGRHHKPSATGRRIATLALAGTALPVGGALLDAGVAHADILDEIARCESGGDPGAQNAHSTASGTFQFLDSTWRSLGGSGSASNASPAEQRRMAEKLYAQQGTAPWNASKGCWGGSGASGVTPHRAAKPAPHKRAERPVAKVAPRAANKAAPKAVKVAPQAPVQRVAPQPVVPAAAHFTPGGDGEYVVKTGDTLSHIAAVYKTTPQRLMELNRDILELPDWVFEGERLHLR